MTATPTVHFNYEGRTDRSRLVYENGDSEELALFRLGPDLRRLEESSFGGDAVYGDIIRVKEIDDGTLLFIEVAERSTLITRSWVLSPEILATERIQSVLKSVMEAGGMWEIAFGGLLMIHLLPNIAESIFEQIISS